VLVTGETSTEGERERRMGIGDKMKNTAQEMKGKLKEKTGDATDNEDQQVEGSVERREAELKQAGEKVKDAFKD
jgi:uncharacterized protein YjbJ (UPF0337 family)